jgi:hypothetical protein
VVHPTTEQSSSSGFFLRPSSSSGLGRGNERRTRRSAARGTEIDLSFPINAYSQPVGSPGCFTRWPLHAPRARASSAIRAGHPPAPARGPLRLCCEADLGGGRQARRCRRGKLLPLHLLSLAGVSTSSRPRQWRRGRQLLLLHPGSGDPAAVNAWYSSAGFFLSPLRDLFLVSLLLYILLGYFPIGSQISELPATVDRVLNRTGLALKLFFLDRRH